MSMEIRNPATGDLLTTVPLPSADEVAWHGLRSYLAMETRVLLLTIAVIVRRKGAR